MPNDPKASVPSPSAPVWRNWSGNLVHEPASDGLKYYFTPTNLAELKSALAEAAKMPGATVRASGQRHSQTPLVVDEDRDPAPQTKAFLVDMSCYRDLGPAQDQRIVLGPGSKQVTVNTGVREDELDAFLTQNNLMLTTVTAGGFFSLGGMTSVDVHGGTMDAPIFAETVSAFTLLLADGSVTTINAHSPAVSGWSPLQFARVSLGALGVVTSVTIDVEDRPWATTLRGGTERFGLADKAAFVETFGTLLKEHTRLETFFTPYATGSVGFPLYAKNFLPLWWDVVSDPPTKTPNAPLSPDNACVLAAKQPPEFGAPYLGQISTYGADLAEKAQYVKSPGNTPSGFIEDGLTNPSIIAAITFEVIEPEVGTANQWGLGCAAIRLAMDVRNWRPSGDPRPSPASPDSGVAKISPEEQ
jgi:FAD/FMN-containing dehydrogenase